GCRRQRNQARLGITKGIHNDFDLQSFERCSAGQIEIEPLHKRENLMREGDALAADSLCENFSLKGSSMFASYRDATPAQTSPARRCSAGFAFHFQGWRGRARCAEASHG